MLQVGRAQEQRCGVCGVGLGGVEWHGGGGWFGVVTWAMGMGGVGVRVS